MEYRYLIRDVPQAEYYHSIGSHLQARMDPFLTYLQARYDVTLLPRAVLLSDAQTATHLISDLPIPAYTNDLRTVFCPEIRVWREIYLRQLNFQELHTARLYYEKELSENHILQILGHEFVHHSDLFLDDFNGDRDSGIWFEEGMCEYISREYFLTPQQFRREAHIQTLLVKSYEAVNGVSSLEDFGKSAYSQDFADIFYFYWKSFLAVQRLVDQNAGDIMAVFREYHRWAECPGGTTLAQWFRLEE